MTQSKDFYSFFFTHLVQDVNVNTNAWVQLDYSSKNFLYLDDGFFTNVSFFVSAYQPKGSISFFVSDGTYLLDASSSISASSDSTTADLTTQNVDNYSSVLPTPITPAFITRDFIYPSAINSQGTEGVLFNQSYPLKTSSVVNPWILESTDFSTVEINPTNLVFNELTADSDLQVDQSHLSNLGSDLLSADRSTYSYFATEDNVSPLDSFLNPDATKKVTLELNPSGLGILDWKVNELSVSKTWVPSSARGYLPSSKIGKKMEGASLKEISLGILGLIAHREDSLLISAIEELTYIWSSLKLIDPSLAGLPSYLPRILTDSYDFSTLSRSRVAVDQSWIGLSIVKAVRYLRDRPLGSLISLPENTTSLLKDLIDVVAMLVDSSTGTTYAAFDEDGFVIDEYDFLASYVAQLFLQSSLSVLYDSKAHVNSSALKVIIQKTDFVSEDDLVFLTYEQSIADLAIYKLFWNVSHSQYFGSESICLKLLDYLEGKSVSSFNYGLLDYLLPFLPIPLDVFNRFSTLESFSHIRAPGLYSYTGEPSSNKNSDPDLCTSTWMRIKLIGFNILPELDFNTYTESASLFLKETFLEAKRLLPFGYRWSSTEAETLTYGRLGALLHSLVFPTFEWYLSNRILKDGVFLLTSQAWALDNQAADLGRVRPELQSDLFFKKSLYFDKNKDHCTKLGLTQLVASLYDSRVDFIEPLVSKLKIDTSFVPWVTTPEILSSIQSTTQVITERPKFPTMEREELGKDLTTTWNKVSPYLNIYSYKYLPNLEQEIVNNISAGVGTNIYVCVSSKSKSFVFTSSSYKN